MFWTAMVSLVFLYVILPEKNNLFAQNEYGFECGFIDSGGARNSTNFGPSFVGLTKPIRTDLSGDEASPSNAVFPVIIVFVQYKDEANNDWQWPTNSAPICLDSLIASEKDYTTDWWEAYDEHTEPISDYYMELSRGKFHVTGKAFSVVLSKTAGEYANTGEINLEVWRAINNEIPDWRVYDKWRDTTINNEIKFIYESDGYVDMIYKIHKNTNGPLWDQRGYAFLSNSQSDGTEILVDTVNNVKVAYRYGGKGSGVTVSFTSRLHHNLLALQHEHGHCLYAKGHITYGKVSYGPGGDGYYSPYEMILMKYQAADVVDPDIQNNYTLGDYSARNSNNGEILKVPISGEECFLIAYRGNLSTWDRPMLGDTNQINGPYKNIGNYGEGIFIYHVNTNRVVFPNGANMSPQDLECADGLWNWTYKGTAQRYAWDAGYCYNASAWPYYLRSSVSYLNDGGWNSNNSDGLSQSPVVWAGVGEINANPCYMGTERMFTNSQEIYPNEEVLGDRYDPWLAGYNEIFSPYSSPSTKKYNNGESDLYIWTVGTGTLSIPSFTASLQIYKVGENEMDEDSILHLTPPSRPMGLRILECNEMPTTYSTIGIKIRWNHNMEPDMLRGTGDNFKRYRIYRIAAEDMSSVPDDAIQYSENIYETIATIDIHKDSLAEYYDNTVVSMCSEQICGPSGCWTQYPVRYRVQAIDKHEDESVLSDFVYTQAWNTEEDEGGMEGDGRPITGDQNSSLAPIEFSLSQNFPNPFNPSTNIRYDLPADNIVSLKIYDITGKEVETLVNEFKKAGSYIISFNGSNLASGVYYYKFVSGEFRDIKRMILIK